MEFLPRALSKPNPAFDDFKIDEQLKGESDPNVTRVCHYQGFVIKRYKPHGLWRIFCAEDFSRLPDEWIEQRFTDLTIAKRAVDEHLKNGDIAQ